jgi:hypothetical protein
VGQAADPGKQGEIMSFLKPYTTLAAGVVLGLLVPRVIRMVR